MNTETIITELRLYNRWRRGDEAITAPDPTALGKLLDDAADRIEHLFASGIHTCHADCQRPMCVLRRERDKALADLASVTADRDGALDRADDDSTARLLLMQQDTDLAALRARVAELEKELEHAQQCVKFHAENSVAQLARAEQAEQRNAELVAALRYYVSVKGCHGEDAAWPKLKDAIACAESGTPAKHPDTERSVKHSRKLNGLAAWLEHEANVRKACATNEGDRWDAGRMSECAEAIREYAARKQGGST